jgi:hypothetical protein
MTTALEGVRGQFHAPAALYPGKDPVHTVQEAGWAPGQVWTGAENLAPAGIRSPNRPTCSQSLYRLRYPALLCLTLLTEIPKVYYKRTFLQYLYIVTIPIHLLFVLSWTSLLLLKCYFVVDGSRKSHVTCDTFGST